jgi:hypothetical protein
MSVVVSLLSLQSYGEEPKSVGLEDMAKTLRGDVRLIAMGDSYCAPYFARVPVAALQTWPIPSISAIGGGAPMNTHLFRCIKKCNPVTLIQSSDDLGYAIERQTSESFFTLPLRGLQEIYTSDDFDDEGTNLLFKFELQLTGRGFLSSGVHGPFTQTGDNVQFRFLYRCPSNLSMQLEEIAFSDGSTESGVAQLRDGARPLWHLGEEPGTNARLAVEQQINALAADFPANNNINTTLTVGLSQTSSLAGTNQYFEPAGCIYYKQTEEGLPAEGLYYNHISDDSWSYSGFGSNAEGNDTHDKKFSIEQFTFWLDVTTLNRDQPTVFMWYLAPESLSYSTALERMTNMIDQANSAASLVGLTSVQHFIVISHLFSMSGGADEEQSRQYTINQQNAAFDLATMREGVSSASIFAATDQVLFIGSDASPWLLEHGFDSFEYGTNTIDLVSFSGGDLLDNSNVHPKNPEAGAFFSAILSEVIREAGCPADLSVDGIINVQDLLFLIEGWGSAGDSDLDGDGTTSINDLLIVIQSWGECWPVQAPFTTPAFRSTHCKPLIQPKDGRR